MFRIQIRYPGSREPWQDLGGLYSGARGSFLISQWRSYCMSKGRVGTHNNGLGSGAQYSREFRLKRV